MFSLSEFGREFRRDVQQLFGTRSRAKPKRISTKTPRKTYTKASIAPIEETPFPITRSIKRYSSYENQKHPKHFSRDPLVAAITDPYGSDRLRHLKATTAAALAFRNAAPISNVGKISTYQTEAKEYYDLRSDLYDARRDLHDLNERYNGRSSDEIVEDIAKLEPSDPNYDDKLYTLKKELRLAEGHEEARDEIRANVKDLRLDTMVALKEAEHAIFEASRGAELAKDILPDFHENFDFPEPDDRNMDEGLTLLPYDQDFHRYSGARTLTEKDSAFLLDLGSADDETGKQLQNSYSVPFAAKTLNPDGALKLGERNTSHASTPRDADPKAEVEVIPSFPTVVSENDEPREEADVAVREPSIDVAVQEPNLLNDRKDSRVSSEIINDIAGLDPSDPDFYDKLDALGSELRKAEEND